MRSGARKVRTLGGWLSLLALYVQVMLPMLVAIELRIPNFAGPDAAAICHSSPLAARGDHGRETGAPRTEHGHARGYCPLCSGVGTPFIAPAEYFVPAPSAWTRTLLRGTVSIAFAYSTVLTYEARAPPLNS